MALRFHLDESVDPAVAIGLRQRGIDVSTAREAGMLGASDLAHLDFARSEHRVLVTHDRDFLRLASDGVEHAGMAYCPPSRRTIGQIVLQLADLNRHHTKEDLHNVVMYL